MKEQLLNEVLALAREYYSSFPDPVKSFLSTLPAADRAAMERLLRGEEVENETEILVRAKQILVMRKKHAESPYGKYQK